MVEEQAVIVEIKDETAMLEIMRHKPCGLCRQACGCRVSLWGKLFRPYPYIFRALNRGNANIGNFVVVSIEERALLISALQVFGIPLLTMLGGALVADIAGGAGNHDAGAVIGAVTGLVLGLLRVKGHIAAADSTHVTSRSFYALATEQD